MDPTGHTAGDLWDPRTYFGGPNERAGAWSGFKEGYFQNAADVGDSLAGFGKGVGKAAWGLGKGTVGLAVKGAELNMKMMSGNPNLMLEGASEAYSMGKTAVGQVKESAVLLARGVANPGDVLDAAAQIGIEKTGEVIGGATFDTAVLVAPAAKGAPIAAVAAEGRRAAVVAAVEESQAARAASRFGEYARRTAAIEEGAAARAAEQAAVRGRVTSNLAESAASRTAQSADGFARYAGLDEVTALTDKLPTAVVARLEGAGKSFLGMNAGAPAATREAVADLAESMGLVKPSYSFMKHAEGDAMIQAFQAGVTGKARMFVSEAPCTAFCATALGKGGIRRMMKVMGLEELEVLWPGNAKGTTFTPLH